MAPDPITESRKKYSQYSKEELKNQFKVAELRGMATEIGIKKIVRNGTEISARNNGRKEELATVIYAACKVYNPKENPVNVEEKAEIQKSDYPIQEDEERLIAQKYYEGKFSPDTNEWQFVGLKECVTRSVTQNKAFVNEFFTLVASFKTELELVVKSRSIDGSIKPATLHNWKAQILKRIEKRVNQDASQFPENVLKENYKRFYDAVQASFAELRRERVEIINTNLNARENQAIDIEVTLLVLWAVDQVTNLPESPSKWREVAIALMILTGRRQSEIMSSGNFTPTDSDCHVMFTGQLKRHDDDKVQGYEIPVLGGCANAVIEALKWLEDNGKREIPEDESVESQQKAAKNAHNRFSRYLSEKAKKVSELIVTENPENWVFVQESGKLKDRRTCHMFRQIYGQCVIPVFYPSVGGSGRKANQILTEVMGHSSSASSRKHAAESYDADVFVKDADKVKQVTGV